MWRDTIMVEEDNCIFATGSNVWMNAGEIADLFNITAASVNRAIKRMLKADVLNDYEVLKLVRLDNGLLMEFYSLELIIERRVLLTCSGEYSLLYQAHKRKRKAFIGYSHIREHQ